MTDDDRDAAPLKVKRYFVDLLIVVNVGMVVFENRGVEWIALVTPLDRFVDGIGDAGLVQAVEKREQEHSLARRAKGIEMLFQRHLSTGQRAGLVATQNVDAAEVLHGFEVFHDHVLASHVYGSAAECDRRDHRQKFGSQSDREGHGE